MEAAKVRLIALISNGKPAEQSTKDYQSALNDFLAHGGQLTDPLVTIGVSVFKSILPTSPVPPGKAVPAPVIIPFDYMAEFMKDTLISYGVPEKEAIISADVLIEADKRGIDSHGIGRLKPIYCDRIDDGILHPYKPIEIVKETETTALVDGALGLGLYIGPYCMNLAIQKAKKYGVGFVAAQNSTHYGIAGYYSTMASKAGCVGFCGTNARPSIAPTFGVEPMLGTNPLCFGIPTDDGFDFNIDCATSVNQRGKIEKYARDGKQTPKGAVIDDMGVERTDTEGILRDMQLGTCALTPVGGAGDDLGGYKGYGWATTVELLCTAFQSGPFGEAVCGIDRATGAKMPMPLGHFFLAIDIEHLCPVNVFKQNSSNLLNAIRASRKSPLGGGRIWTAGEPENDARTARTAQGGLSVPYPLQKDMIALRNKIPALKSKYPKLSFE
jgi:LDH2 family malate/lactate/ureidoglycolate dehydrogenase|mmetsp:Transcript_34447/g.32814  ORF Transcript_34447/g.32814 Transcript_34447/m.32814 type:complete len:441 (-) Transcript_34447:470-1792(-)|eukprot:CAMPEP_0119036224 /NCGR_PEP_ID=MMETSP1177-20130426/3781_1 /TAXON_ID=2985 /ORGANISM="Ochromonas sp, Strain CCMP1899" /LENGTH=440 /DNA_ID=CAMNT_0006995737 /DNA_START=132 /DNA_END=1454 /DNA_ORIENTATION=-